jgi:hypothetical protein
MTSKFIFSGVLALLLSQTVKSQDCSDLLKQGLREYTKVITQTENYQQASSAICEAYQEYKSSNDAAKANAKYKSIFKGSANYSKQQIEEIGKLYCEQNFAQSSSGQYGEYQASFIDPNYARMYSECLTASGRNIKLELKPNGALNNTITITASYLSPSNYRPKVTGINYDSTLLKVVGPLKDAAISKLSLDGYATLIATRQDIKNAPFLDGNDFILAKEFQMTLQFENAAITIDFPRVYPNPPKVELKKGVGEIVASMLPVDKFLDLYGRSDWALADGSKTPDNKAYKLISDTLPDLRGVFLRGKNYSRLTSTGNPEKDVELGTYAYDAFKNHTHDIKYSVKSENFQRAFQFRSEKDVPSQFVESGNSKTGGVETRPRNVTVNYFIRIN